MSEERKLLRLWGAHNLGLSVLCLFGNVLVGTTMMHPLLATLVWILGAGMLVMGSVKSAGE